MGTPREPGRGSAIGMGFPYHVRDFVNARGGAWLARYGVSWGRERGGDASDSAHRRTVSRVPRDVWHLRREAGDTFLGDVIVADRVYSYDHGKLVVGEEKDCELFHDIKDQQPLEAVVEWRWKNFGSSKGTGREDEPPAFQTVAEALAASCAGDARGGCHSAARPSGPGRETRCPGWKRMHRGAESRKG